MTEPSPPGGALVPVRAAQARQAAGAATVVLVSGASGIGKSSVLATVGHQLDGAVVPSVWELARSEDLDQVILRQLGAALQQIAAEQGVAAIGERLRGAVLTLAPRVGLEVAAAAAVSVLNAATGGLTSELATRLAQLREEFAAQGAEGLAAAIEGTLRPNALEVVLEFAAATAALADGRAILARIDQGQRLKEDGARLLADLAERLPPQGLQLILAWSTESEGARTRLKSLLAEESGCFELALEPLDEAQLAAWRPPGLEPTNAGRVLALTGGSPLVIDDAARVGLPHEGEGAVAELVGRALARLEQPTRDALARLVVFERRPPEQDLLDLLAPHDWLALEAQLLAVGLLSELGEGRAWLHRLRRHAVLDSLTAEQRVAAARDAYDVLAPRAGADDSWQAELLALARQAEPSWEPDSPERRLLDLADDDVAVLAAHFELAPLAAPSVVADPLLRYARSGWDASAGVEASLSRLAGEDLIALGAGRYPLRVSRTERCEAVFALLCGRCIERLGRRPVLDLANAVVLSGARAALGSPLERFARVGEADVYSLVRLADAVLPDHERDQPPAALIAALRFRGVPVALVAAYAGEAERDAAVAEVKDLVLPLFGKQLAVEQALALPSTPTASQRWLRALERGLGADREEIDSVRELASSLPLAEALARKLDTYEAVFALAGEPERWAMDVDRRMALAWTTQDKWFVELEIHGGREGITSTRLPPVFADEPLSYFRLEEALALAPEEKLLGPRGSTPGPGGDLPEVEALEQLDERAGAYNGTLPTFSVLLDPVSLQAQLAAALQLEHKTAMALRERLPAFEGKTPPLPLGLVLIIPSHTGAEGWDWRHSPGCAFFWQESPQTRVEVIASDRLDAPFEQAALRALEAAGLRLDERHLSYGWSELHHFLASVLGYRVESLSLRWP